MKLFHLVWITLTTIPSIKSKCSILFCKYEEIRVEDLNIDIEPRLEILKVEEPKSREAGIMVKSVDEMIEKLKNEAKVIYVRGKYENVSSCRS